MNAFTNFVAKSAHSAMDGFLFGLVACALIAFTVIFGAFGGSRSDTEDDE
jgi:hypothetical protein